MTGGHWLGSCPQASLVTLCPTLGQGLGEPKLALEILLQLWAPLSCQLLLDLRLVSGSHGPSSTLTCPRHHTRGSCQAPGCPGWAMSDPAGFAQPWCCSLEAAGGLHSGHMQKPTQVNICPLWGIEFFYVSCTLKVQGPCSKLKNSG